MNTDHTISILERCEKVAPVLVVDDQEAIRKLLTRYLAMKGLHAESVESAEVALEWMDRNGAPSVLVTDLIMSGMNGYELMNQVMLRHPSVKTLLISACFQMLRMPASCEKAVCVNKPIDLPQFYQAISALVSSTASARAV